MRSDTRDFSHERRTQVSERYSLCKEYQSLVSFYYGTFFYREIFTSHSDSLQVIPVTMLSLHDIPLPFVQEYGSREHPFWIVISSLAFLYRQAAPHPGCFLLSV